MVMKTSMECYSCVLCSSPHQWKAAQNTTAALFGSFLHRIGQKNELQYVAQLTQPCLDCLHLGALSPAPRGNKLKADRCKLAWGVTNWGGPLAAWSENENVVRHYSVQTLWWTVLGHFWCDSALMENHWINVAPPPPSEPACWRICNRNGTKKKLVPDVPSAAGRQTPAWGFRSRLFLLSDPV